MSLFQNLLRLYPNFGERTPTEDFFTEVAAHLLQTHPGLVTAWLKQLGIADGDYQSVRVKTQTAFPAVQVGEPANRVDILLELEAEDGILDWVIVESKLDAPEGGDQLRRYAALLLNRAGLRRRSLVYVTRDYDPKDAADLLGDLQGVITFRQTRWHEFYHLVKRLPQDSMLEEAARFMEDLGMAMDNAFSPGAISTMINLSATVRLMDSVLADEVAQKMKSVMGSADRSTQTRLRYLVWNYYLIRAEMDTQFEGFTGFHLDASPENGYPTLIVRLQVSSRSPKCETIINRFRQIEKEHANWVARNLDQPDLFAAVTKTLNLSSALGSGDRVAACKTFLLQALDDVAQFRNQYPDVPWTR